MAHIHTEPGQYDLTVSAFIVCTDPEPRLLLHRHKVLGVLMQPGGHVELHENPWEAITHEILEEAGYDIDQLSVLQPRLRMTITPETGALPQPMTVRCFRFGDEEHFHTDLTYAFVTTEMPRHGVGEGESADLMWVTSDELAQIHTYDDVREVGLFVLDYLVSEWEAVPLHPTHTQIKSLPESTAE